MSPPLTLDLLPEVAADRLEAQSAQRIDTDTMAQVAEIVADVRGEGDAALRRHALALGDLSGDEPMVHGRDALEAARDRLQPQARETLERTHERIARFAEAQLDCLSALSMPLPGGRAGHRIIPVARVGAYAPGGRYPLPSSVLMTVTPARIAGVGEVTVASPRPGDVTLAAAAVAGADRLVTVGGAQVIAALAYGTETVPACDLIVGPGNRWVTAAKKQVFGDVGIDMLAGPSELVVLADGDADPRIVAADLIAQAEHDVDARPFLVTTSPGLVAAVRRELESQLQTLPSAATARASLATGRSVLARDLDEAVAVCERLAPEHLELMVGDPTSLAERLRHYGTLFVGEPSAEVFGDYGSGPNHVLPTGGGARFTGGLSVFAFLRVTTWLHLESATEHVGDAAALARLEGLEGHARAAESRLACREDPSP